MKGKLIKMNGTINIMMDMKMRESESDITFGKGKLLNDREENIGIFENCVIFTKILVEEKWAGSPKELIKVTPKQTRNKIVLEGFISSSEVKEENITQLLENNGNSISLHFYLEKYNQVIIAQIKNWEVYTEKSETEETYYIEAKCGKIFFE